MIRSTSMRNMSMLRATSIVRKPAVKADKVADVVVLDHEDRQRRRIALQARGGLAFLLDLDKPAVLNEGDALKLEDGRLIAVEPAPQKLLEIRAENPLRLMRVAWHIGNRHTPAEITADALYIEDDHVLAEMIRGQGCSLTPVTRAFRPERGAYDHGGHHHDHGHGHDHDHGYAAHVNPPHGQPGHVHGPDCDHDHHHDHSHDVLDVKSHGHDHHDHGHHHGHEHGHKHSHDHGHDHGHDHSHGAGARHKHDH
jgi:urease accessory protein